MHKKTKSLKTESKKSKHWNLKRLLLPSFLTKSTFWREFVTVITFWWQLQFG